MKTKKIQIFLLTVLLGVLMTLQISAIQTKYKYVSVRDFSYLKDTLNQERLDLELLENQKSDLEAQITDFEENPLNEAEMIAFLESEIERVNSFANLTSLKGQGVIIIVNDSERDLNQGENPNNVLVHDIDIQALVQDLQMAGAEAISINGERYVFGVSEIECTGPTIRINDKVYAQPFIIKAIGDKQYLKSAINAPGNYGEILRNYGIFIEVHTSVSIRIPGYEGGQSFEYIKTEEE